MSKIEDAEKPSAFTRVKKFIQENQGPLTFGAGIGLGAIIVSQYPEVFLKAKSSRYPFGSSYRSAPDLAQNVVPCIHMPETVDEFVELFKQYNGAVIVGSLEQPVHLFAKDAMHLHP